MPTSLPHAPSTLRGTLVPSVLALALLLSGCSELALTRATGGSFEEGSAPPEYDGDGTAWGDDDDSDDDDDRNPGGYGRPERVDPEAGSDTHHYRDPITVWFDADGRGATVSVVDGQGRAVPSERTWSEDGTRLTLQPEPWLLPDSEYALVIDVASEIRVGFRTSTVGLPLEDPASLAGRTFSLDVAEGRVHRPAGVGSLFAAGAAGLSWLWQVQDLEVPEDEGADASLAWDSGLAFEDEGGLVQDLCVPTAALGRAEFPLTGSYFAGEAASLALHVGNDTLLFEEGWVDGDFLADGEGLRNVGLRGMLRADSASGLLSGGDVCELLADIGAERCEVCPSGDGWCIPVQIDGVDGFLRGQELEPVDADGLPDDCDGDAAEVLGCSAAAAPASGAGLLLLLPPLLARIRRRG